MPIYKTALTSNFTQIDNSIINGAMPPVAFKIFSYLISKPDTWQPKAHDIKKQLGLSAYATKKALRWLCNAGYAAWVRLKSGHTIWHIFSNPENTLNDAFDASFAQPETGYSPTIPPQVEKPQGAIQPDLIINKQQKEILKTLPATAAPPRSAPITPVEVVVSDNELIYPVQLTPVQKKAARAVIKKVKQPEIQQPVLFALAYAITNGTVKSPVAYLNGLISRANNGTFEAVTADSSNKANRPIVPIWQGHKSAPPIDNNSFFAELQQRFGSKATTAMQGVTL